MKLAAFDMDGTLYDTNMVNYKAYNAALAQYDRSLDYEYYRTNCNGNSYLSFLPLLLNNDMDKVEKVHNLKKALYAEYLNEARVNNSLFEILECLRMYKNYKIALVTTASQKNTMDILKHTGKTNDFDFIVTADDITKPKPNPEGYLKAMNHFSIAGADTIVFEDTIVGKKAAEEAGATVFLVGDWASY